VRPVRGNECPVGVVFCVSLDVTGANRQMLGRPWFDPGWPDIRKRKVDPNNSGSRGQQRKEHRYNEVSERRYGKIGLSPRIGLSSGTGHRDVARRGNTDVSGWRRPARLARHLPGPADMLDYLTVALRRKSGCLPCDIECSVCEDGGRHSTKSIGFHHPNRSARLLA
jgi:hypothetical protein